MKCVTCKYYVELKYTCVSEKICTLLDREIDWEDVKCNRYIPKEK